MISGVVLPLSLFFGPIILGELGIYHEDARPILKRYIKYIAIIFCVSASLYMVTPDAKTLAAMYIVPEVAQNGRLQHLAGNSVQAFEQLVQKWIQDLMMENDSCKK